MKIIFLGSGEIGLPSLQWLVEEPSVELLAVVTQPDRPSGRGLEVRQSAIKQFAHEKNIPILQPNRLREKEVLETLARLEPDFFVVMAYGQLLSREALAIPKCYPLNLHASLLPRHRGASPINSAILAGDRETGISVMVMDEGLDTGDILLQTAIPIRRRETAGSLHDRLALLAPAALAETFASLKAHKIKPIPQENTQATYAPKIEVCEAMLDWHLSAVDLERRIRAYNPWPGGYTILRHSSGNKERLLRLKIFSAIVCSKTHGEVGRVIAVSEQGVMVGCGQGSVLLKEVQLEGKRRMTASELSRGHSLLNARFEFNEPTETC